MTESELLIALFALLLAALLLPLPHGLRTALFLALAAVSALTFLGGGMRFLLSAFG